MLKETREAFTLAEVLLTLTIIGVVAAATIPTLIANVSDEQYKAAFKKTYSTVGDAVLALRGETRGTLKDYFTDAADMRDKFASKLSTTKSCDAPCNTGGCWHDWGNWYTYGGAPIMSNNPTGAPLCSIMTGLILNDGTLITFHEGKPGSGTPKTVGFVGVDVNGFKGPNRIAKDIYVIHIQEEGVLPQGGLGDI